MRLGWMIAPCLVATLTPAQDDPRAARPDDRAPHLVVGEVQHQRLPCKRVKRGTPLLELLMRAKPKPHADLGRALLLRGGSGSFAIVSVDVRELRRAGTRALRAAPGAVLVVPGMRQRKVAADRAQPFAALQSILLRTGSARVSVDTELAIRLFLLRRHPDRAVCRSQALRIRALGAAALPAVPVLRALATRGRGHVRDLAARASRSISRAAVGGLCACDCFPAGTGVRTARGLMPIELLRAGAVVLDGRDAPVVVRRVSRGLAPRLVELDLGSTVIRATIGHRFLTRARGWVAAGKLRARDVLVTSSGATRIRSVVIAEQKQLVPVYNLVLAAESQASFQVGVAGIVVGSE